MLSPVNDLVQIEVETDKFGFDTNVKDSFSTGIVVAVPEVLNYFGAWSFISEVSWMNTEKLEELRKHYAKLVGKRVFWTSLSEKGNVLHDPKANKTWVFLKLSSLIAVADNPDDEYYGVLDAHNGAFSA